MVQKRFEQIRIQSRRLVLRPYKASDFKRCTLSHSARLPSKSRFEEPIPIGKESSAESFNARVDRYKMLGNDRHHFVFGVFDRKTRAFVGQVDLFMINKQLRWGNLGYHIQNQYAGKGYATEASELALRLAFSTCEFHRIEAAMEPSNRASKKVAQKLGLRYEGKRLKFFPDSKSDLLVFATNAVDYQPAAKPKRRKN